MLIESGDAWEYISTSEWFNRLIGSSFEIVVISLGILGFGGYEYLSTRAELEKTKATQLEVNTNGLPRYIDYQGQRFYSKDSAIQGLERKVKP